TVSTDDRNGDYQSPSKLTFGQYVDEWKPKYLIAADLKLATITGYHSALNKHLVPYFGKRPIVGIRTADITKFRSELLQSTVATKGTPTSRKHARNILNFLNRIFADAVE